MDLLDEEKMLNETIDFSFKLHWVQSGDWGNYADYEVKVSDTTSVVIPEKKAMSSTEFATIDISSIKKREEGK